MPYPSARRVPLILLCYQLETWRDQLVDLSRKVRPGKNKIELYAGRPDVDHSCYVFALRLHPLTPRQAAWWWDRKRCQKRWEQMLRRLSRMKVPPIDLSWRTKHAEHMYV